MTVQDFCNQHVADDEIRERTSGLADTMEALWQKRLPLWLRWWIFRHAKADHAAYLSAMIKLLPPEKAEYAIARLRSLDYAECFYELTKRISLNVLNMYLKEAPICW